MTEKNPVDLFKHVAGRSLSTSTSVAQSGLRAATRLAHTGLAAGAQMARTVTRSAGIGSEHADSPSHTDSPGHTNSAGPAAASTAPDEVAPDGAAPDGAEPDEADTAEPADSLKIDPERPINVVEELGLDPAPVPDTRPKPTTRIDAAADPEQVEATPADVARVVDPHQPKG